MYLNHYWRSGHVSPQGWWSRHYWNAGGGVFNTARPYIPSAAPSVAVRQFSAENSGKDTMQSLNERLASYLDKVSQLEASNQALEQQIHEYLNKKTPEERRDYEAKLQTVNGLREEINGYFCTIAKLNLEIEHTQYESKDYQIKIDEEARMCLSSESEISLLEALQRDSEAQNVELEFEISQKEEEMAYIQSEWEENLLELRSQASGSVNVELAIKDSADLIQELHDLREQCMAVVEKNQKEVEKWFDKKMSELQTTEKQESSETESSTTALRDLKKTVQNLTIELQQLHSQMSVLEQNKMEMTTKYSLCLHQYQMRVNSLEEELQRLRADINQQGALYQELLDIKTHLELEITQYKKILDGEGISERASTSSTAVISASINTSLKNSTTAYSALTNGTHDQKQTTSSAQAIYSSVEGRAGSREIHQSRFLGDGSTGTLVVQEQIIVSKQGRPVTSKNEKLGSAESQVTARSQVTKSLSDHSSQAKSGTQSIYSTETIEIKRTGDVTDASLQDTAIAVKPTSGIVQTNRAAAESRFANTGINTTERLVKTSIFEKVMAWDAPQDQVEINTKEIEVEVSVPKTITEFKTISSISTTASTGGNVEAKATRTVTGTSAMESLLGTNVTAGTAESSITKGVVEIPAPERSVEVKTTGKVVSSSVMESLLNTGSATSEAKTAQGLVEISVPKSTVEVETTRTLVGTSARESLLNAGLASGAAKANIAHGIVELSASASTVEVRTTREVVGKSNIESFLNTGVATGTVEANVAQGVVEISAPSSTFEVSTSREVGGKSAMERLLNTGIVTGAGQANIAQGVVDISAPTSAVEVKTTKSVIGASAMESLLNTSVAAGAAESNQGVGEVRATTEVVGKTAMESLLNSGIVETHISQGPVQISSPKSSVEVETTRRVVGSSAMESLLNSGIAMGATKANIGVVTVSAPESTVEVRTTTEVVGKTAMESLLNTGVTTGTAGAESNVEKKTTRTVVGTTAMERLLNSAIASGTAETSIAEISVPESTVEVKTTGSIVGTSAIESLLTTGTAIGVAESNSGTNIVEILAPDNAVQGSTTRIVVGSTAMESLLKSGIATGPVETEVAEGVAQTSTSQYIVETRSTEVITATESIPTVEGEKCVAETSTASTLVTTPQGDIQTNIVQGIPEAQLSQHVSEIMTSVTTTETTGPVESMVESNVVQNVVVTSVSEGTVDMKMTISEGQVESANIQTVAEIAAPGSTLEIKTGENVVAFTGTENVPNVQTVEIVSESISEIKATGIVGTIDSLSSTTFGEVVVEARVLESIAEVSVADSSAESNAAASAGSATNVGDISSKDIRLSNGTHSRFELKFVGADTTQDPQPARISQTGNAQLSQSALPGHVDLPIGLEEFAFDGVARYVGRSSEVMIGSSHREARISQPRRTSNSEISGEKKNTSPGSERRMTRQRSISPKSPGTGASSAVSMGSTRAGRRTSSPGRSVVSSSGSQRQRLNSTGSVGSDAVMGCGTGMGNISSPTKPGHISSAGTGVWIMTSDSTADHSPYTISTRSRGSGDKITVYGSGMGAGRISSAGSGNRISSAGSGNRISSAGSGNRTSSAGSGGRISSAESGNRISSAGSGGKISSAGSGNRISSAGSGGRISSAGSGGRISSAGSGGKISSAGSGNKISYAGSGGRISSAGTGSTRISSASPMGSRPVNTTVIRSTGSSGGGSNRERISVCKMAALSKAAAVKEKSQESQGLQQRRSGMQDAIDPDEEFTNTPAVP
ncbi:hypothetical protein ACEWY4_002449 [Coilia grayii]|uniref:IF rod domain-containing protein n=1 Tax=Coilia grayii TaxID=363190 RepID=A0ABD1KNJ5_9TELE